MKGRFEHGFRICKYIYLIYLPSPSTQDIKIDHCLLFRVADKLNASICEVPLVKPSHLSDKVCDRINCMLVPKLTIPFEELNFFTESMIKKWKVLGGTSPYRELHIGDYTDDDGLLQSNDYKTKIRAGKHVRTFQQMPTFAHRR